MTFPKLLDLVFLSLMFVSVIIDLVSQNMVQKHWRNQMGMSGHLRVSVRHRRSAITLGGLCFSVDGSK